MAGTDFSHLTSDELIKGIKALDLPDYIRSKAYGIDVRETLAQMTEMTIQLGVNMGLSPNEALKWARKLQETVSQSEFDSWVATLLDGGPSIFMNTLSELQTTYPNGAPGVALVRETDPAKIYVWNGTAWEDFGDYQGIELKDDSVTTNKIADKAVTPKKTTYLNVLMENLFNKADITMDKIINFETGALYSQEFYFTTGFIEIEPNTLYSFSEQAQNRVFYDVNKDIISGAGGGATTVTTPPNSKYIRFSRQVFRMDIFMFVKGDTIPSEYFPFGKQLVTYSDNIQFSDDTPQQTPTRSKLYGKKWNALGDSITYGAHTTKPYHQYIAEKTGCIVTNYGISSSTVTTVNDGGFEPFVNRYMDMSDDADIITVLGGVNDAGYGSSLNIGDIDSTDIATFYGAYNMMLDGLIKKYPTKLIVTMTPLKADDGWRTKLPDVAKAVKEVSQKYSVPCLDLYSMSGISLVDEQQALLQPDFLHPNEVGHKIIAGKIMSFLENLMPI